MGVFSLQLQTILIHTTLNLPVVTYQNYKIPVVAIKPHFRDAILIVLEQEREHINRSLRCHITKMSEKRQLNLTWDWSFIMDPWGPGSGVKSILMVLSEAVLASELLFVSDV